MIGRIRHSILLKISALIIALCLIVMVFSSYGLYLGWTSYQQASELSVVRDMTQNFLDGLKNFMFERGRMNVVLSKEQPISDENSAFLSDRRAAADEAFEAGFSAMEKSFPKETAELRQEYRNIEALRVATDAQSQRPLGDRDVSARLLWFRSCTDFIDTVITRINVIRQLFLDNGDVSYYFDVVVDSLHFRSVVGNESSIITSSIAAGGRLSNTNNATLLFLMGEEAEVWSDLEGTVAMLGSDELTLALENVREKYYGLFKPEQEKIMEMADNDQLYEGADKIMADLSVPALDSVLLLSDAAVRGIESENRQILAAGLQSFLTGLGQMLVSLLMAVFVPIYFRRRFVQPLNDIIRVLGDISEGDVGSPVPHVKRTDEIGMLAHGADMLKNSVIKEQALKQEAAQTMLQLEGFSIRDALTGLYNRRYLTGRLEEYAILSMSHGSVFSLVMCDIDNFKSFNDKHGHECGDRVLTHIAEQLSSHCREKDIVARWGGEEFMFLLPDTGLEGAGVFAERVRAGLEGKTYACDLFELNVTMTFGVAQYDKDQGVPGTIRRADMALLRGKNSGRNQVVVFRDADR